MKVSKTLQIMLIAAFTLLASNCSDVLQAAATAAPASTTICAAILEPEVTGDLPSDQLKTLGGTLDTLLTESLGGQKGFVLVDRQALNKVLNERKVLTANRVA